MKNMNNVIQEWRSIMNNKENYIKKANEIFKDNEKTKETFINQMNLFYEANENYKNPQYYMTLREYIEQYHLKL